MDYWNIFRQEIVSIRSIDNHKRKQSYNANITRNNNRNFVDMHRSTSSAIVAAFDEGMGG